MDKQKILDNVSQFSDGDLAGFIVSGVVTMKELLETGEFPASRRKKVKALIDGREDRDWEDAKAKNTVEAYRNYLESYQAGKNREEARDRIKRIEADAQISDEWKRVDKSCPSDLRAFIDAHPGSSYASEAQKILDELERQAWNNVDKDDKESLQRFVNEFPNSLFVSKAKKLIAKLEEDIIKGKNLAVRIKECFRTGSFNDVFTIVRGEILSGRKQNVLNVIKDDNNILPRSVVKELINGGEIDHGDLLSIGIEEKFLSFLFENPPAPLASPSDTLKKIHRQKTTEVYFWGIPASGKTCALGAIMSVAKGGRVAKSLIMDTNSQAYGYMQRLSSLFEKNQVSYLPAGTAVSSICEMAFDLIDEKNNEHSVTFIDLAGELVRCMNKHVCNEPLNDEESETLETATRILSDNRGVNTKIHFFVIEYGGEDKKFNGVPQKDYLQTAMNYIEKTGIIAKDTDAIFLIVTKVDKMKYEKGQLHEKLWEYVDNAYRGFYNQLEHICKRNDINGGKVEIVPFSLGKVCFQSFCLFDDMAASQVLKKILCYTKEKRTGFWGKVIRIFAN